MGQTAYLINGGNVTDCYGILGTTGGVDGEEYGNNEDHTITICPGTPGVSVRLTFNGFSLSTDGSGPGDQMSFFDGSDTGAPLIGSYGGNELNGSIIAATPDNPSGCVTVRFTSNETGTGTFSAFIDCYDPCWPPTADAVIIGETLPAMVCLGEVLDFDGGPSFAHPGRTITNYSWDMNDGTVLTGQSVSHGFAEPGEYQVELVVTDDVGCTNNFQLVVPVRVGTVPTFEGVAISASEICRGGEVTLNGAVTSPVWSNLPQPFIEGLTELPDGSGVTYESEMSVSGFPFGTVVSNPTDVASVCIVMEHSYMGDLVVNLESPNGAQVLLFNGNPGGAIYLGGANNLDDLTPGEGWLYCFQNTATLGTLAAEAVAGNTVIGGSNPPDDAMPAGTYTSEGSFTGFIGTELNGTWTLSMLDDAFIDDGFIFEWYITFNPLLYPDIVSFAPVYGMGPDSTFWSGPDITGMDPGGDAITVIPATVGPLSYTYTAINDFGCTYDTTITINSLPPPVVDVTSTQGICTEQAELMASIVANPPPPLPCSYSLILNDSEGDGWNGGAHLTITVNGQATDYTLASGSTITIQVEVPFGTPFQMNYTAGTIWNGENSFQLISPAGTIIYSSPNGPLTGNVWNGAGVCAIVPPVTYTWTPNNAVSANNIPNPTTTISAPTFYTVAIYPIGQPWCTTQDTITVEPPSVLENDSLVTDVLCNGGTGTVEINTIGLGGPWNYRWTDATNTVVREVGPLNGDVLTATAGDYSVVVTEGPNGNGCSDTVHVTITEPPLLVWTLVPVDTMICLDGSAMLAAETEGGTAPVSYVWDQGLVGPGPHSVSPVDSTVYTVHAVDAHDCMTSPVAVLVGVRDSLWFDPLVDFEQCSGVPFDLQVVNIVGGDGAYGYDWSSGNSTDALLTDSLLDDATYCVTVTDGCETPPITSCTDITVLHTPAFELTTDTVLGCRPFEVAFALRDTTGGALVAWRFGEGESAIAGPLLSHLYNRSGTFDVSTEVTWPNGCVTDSTWTDLITVIPVPKPAFSYSPEPLTIFEPHARFTELAGPNEVGYAWDFFDLGTSDEADPEITFPNVVGDLYPVQLVVWNELGCADTLLRYIPVEDAFLIHAPNSFTPNGDDLNETFQVLGNDLSRDEFNLDIFDRWGHVVFSTTSPELGWDGKVNGTAAEVGVYVWRLKARSLQTLEKHILYGHVSLLR